MEHFLILLLMIVSGFVLGILYFAALMKTMNNFMAWKKWKLMMVASFLLRAGLLVGAFFVMAGTDWQRIATLVLGFMIARIVMVHRVKKSIPLKERTGAA